MLKYKGVAKRYGDNSVIHDLDLKLVEGEVLALVGENGAGKSTLMKMTSGLEELSAGELTYLGEPLLPSLETAEQAGIVMVHQEFNLVPDLTVAENIFLGREPTRFLMLNRRDMEEKARRILESLHCDVSPSATLRNLSVSTWQMVELAKAFARTPKILLLDEPTAVLSAPEAQALFARCRKFRSEGGAVIFTSHRLDEVLELADRVVVLRDGCIIRDSPAETWTERDIAEAMVGRPLAEIYPAKTVTPTDSPVLSVTDLCVPGFVQSASLSVFAGEILGVAGLVGSGRTELFEALCGLRAAHCPRFSLQGQETQLPTARAALKSGLAYLTEDRKGHGLLLEKPLAENLALTVGAVEGGVWLDTKLEQQALDAACQRYSITAKNRSAEARSLSGGNQQKLLIAKTLSVNPDFIVFDEPTRGVDIGAKEQIYKLIVELARAGKAIVVISSEMQEIIGLSHRVIVMRRGAIAGQLQGTAITEKEIIHLAVGTEEDQASDQSGS